MGQRLSPEQIELYRRVDEVLYYLWDPIGVSDAPEARDEYRAYLPQVFTLLIHGAGEVRVAEFLTRTTTQTMGLTDTARGRKHDKAIAALLQKHYTISQQRRVA